MPAWPRRWAARPTTTRANDWWLCGCDDDQHIKPEELGEGDEGPPILKDYDTDWSATGPLIERYGFTIAPSAGIVGFNGVQPWVAYVGGLLSHQGPTPLVAVCTLLIDLHEQGKLEARS